MVSSRKRVFTEKIRRRMFTKDMFDGARLLFDQIHQNVSDEIVSDVMEFNAKLNLNFGLRQVRFEYAFCINWLYSL
jgi:exportin-7